MSAQAAPVISLRGAPPQIRVVTATSLFDGHDASINIMRRLLQAEGGEVIHLGHDRSVDEIVEAAVQEGAHAIAVSSYQGGHMEFFRYMVDRLRECGAPDVRIYGGGGGTIRPDEIQELQDYGVTRIFSPDDGRRLGLQGMIKSILDECREAVLRVGAEPSGEALRRQCELLSADNAPVVSRFITWLEEDGATEPGLSETLRAQLSGRAHAHAAPVVGFTGTGGAGKSSVVDELVRRLRIDYPKLAVGLLLIDPTRRRSGGALLGDRIRMNAIHGPGLFARSMATRQAHLAVSKSLHDAVLVLQAARFDLIFVETAGIGQRDSEIVDLVDISLYVMTPEFGAPSQLEKIDMLDLADFAVLNKFDRQGAQDALRDVRKQWRRNRGDYQREDSEVPVFPTVARAWNDPGTDRLYEALRLRLLDLRGGVFERPEASSMRKRIEARRDWTPEREGELATALIAPSRTRYLADVAGAIRGYRRNSEHLADRAGAADGLARALRELGAETPAMGVGYGPEAVAESGDPSTAIEDLRRRYNACLEDLDGETRRQLAAWPEAQASYRADEQEYEVRGRSIRVENRVETLARTRLPKVALPRSRDWADLVRYFRGENLPGRFPYTAGVFPFRRSGEDPTRMFAGEGGPERTNRRFHYLCRGQPAVRLSTAFDSVTLYGRDPDERPDVYGKVGNSGVSICSLDDAKKLYSGFDLCAPNTSVSLTINGPAPIVLAFFLNAAVDQQVERHLRETGQLEAARRRFAQERELPEYTGDLPEGHDGFGLGLLGIPGDQAVEPETYARIKRDALARVRGTVQADILKEDQAQNTCIFSTEFALKLMGDIQEHFVAQAIANFYSVSISGYHMAEAGANPITQLAFTLANGFTYCEYYLARGLAIDEFAPSFSFFFSNGLDAEYSVIGRVARRIWAVAMRERYGASERSQKLKYHIQTSGRSLHAQEMSFNDIRTTLQALMGLQDGCNSLHTNAYDEAVTTPTEESVRRALAIQLIINRELGTGKNENPIQGAYLTDELTDLVEAAVLREFERLSERGGVLGAMETQYQRSQIQEESLHYESLKHSGDLPIIGVNTFENPNPEETHCDTENLMRSTEEEKRGQLAGLAGFHRRWQREAPAALAALQAAALREENVFAELMETVKTASLGQIADALFEVGGRYRRSM
jgi:methylmalonyl-CoA mutase